MASADHVKACTAHVLETLPDSISRRRMVLRGLLQLLPGKLPLRNDVARVLDSLDMHEDAQLKFASLVTGGRQ